MKNIPHAKQIVPALGAFSILAYFFWLTGGALTTQFSHDDLMNIYRAWLDPLPRILKENLLFCFYPTAYRPLGNLFYHLLFEKYGFNPLPYRICLLVFLLANIWLVYALTRRLSGSRETGALTALLHGYHIGFIPLYRNTGTCFDILCFFFYFCALLYYVRIRQQDRFPRPLEQVRFLVLFILALNAKEIAVTLPVMTGLYELFYHPPRGFQLRPVFSWIRREGLVTCWGALLNVAYLAIKIYGPGGVTTVGGYKTTIGLATYLASLRHDLDEVLTTWGTNFLRMPTLLILLLALMAIAWRWRRPHFRFALLFWLAGVLPVSFIPQRSIYAIYIPLVGFDICAASLIVAARERVWRAFRRHASEPAADVPSLRRILTFALLAIALGRYYQARGAYFYTWLDEENQQIAGVIADLRVELPKPKKGAHILFLENPFATASNDEWGVVFITRLLYRDDSILPDRLWLMPHKPDAAAMQKYDYVFSAAPGSVTLVAPAGLAKTAAEAVRKRPPARPPWTPKPLFNILLGAAVTIATSLALGFLVIHALRLKFYAGEERVMAFVFGSALLSNIVFLLAAAGWARKGVFFIISALILAAFARAREGRATAPQPSPLPVAWKIFAGVIVGAFSWYYVANALAPEVSPDGVTYHLGLVYRYARAHGFERITTNFYASLSEGMEMLFLFAFSIGRHSAAAMVHCAFLYMLFFAMVRYGQRFGMPIAALCGALLMFAAPVVGFDGVIAYNDVGAAAVAFATYYLLRMWTDDRDTRTLALAGLCAGFAYAVKYPAGIAVLYGLAAVAFRTGWKDRKQIVRNCGVFAAFAAVSIVPWMIKDWIYVANPVAPFFNRVFPNPYITVDFEDLYRGGLAHNNGLTLSDIPWEATVRGYRMGGLFGPVFLLAPVALLALRKKEGRRLLTAALVFAMPVLTNKDARFLISAVPFLSIAMGMALARLPLLAGAVVLAHAITSWPGMIDRYSARYAWHLRVGAPWKAALRRIPEERFIAEYVPEYPVSTMLDKDVPLRGRVFSFSPIASAYCAREVMIDWWGAENYRLRDTMYLPLGSDYRPMWRFTFRFPERALHGVRIVQTAAGTDFWKISEVSLGREGIEVPINSNWRAQAEPFPWTASLAMDGRPITYWRADRRLAPGMFYKIGFNGVHRVDAVFLDCPQNQFQVRLVLEGETAPGHWERLASASGPEPGPLTGFDLRRAATAELRRSGIGYLLIPPNGYIKKDVENDPAAWGLTSVDAAVGWQLYLIR